jgi:two-component system nitrate/nitrite response regulator NarL
MPHTRAISIGIVDSEPIFAIGVLTLLARHPGLSTVGTAERNEEALDLVARTRPDVLLVDHHPPWLNAVELVGRLKQAGYPTRVIIVAVKMPEAQIQAALLQGAWGVVSKASAGDVLPTCIEQVMKGRQWIGLESVDAFVAGLRAPKNGCQTLTQREVQIVKRVGTGASNKEIASTLKIGEQTVKNGLRRIFRKLGIASRVELALLAVQQGQGHQ